jgi:hypothetical protein
MSHASNDSWSDRSRHLGVGVTRRTGARPTSRG